MERPKKSKISKRDQGNSAKRKMKNRPRNSLTLASDLSQGTAQSENAGPGELCSFCDAIVRTLSEPPNKDKEGIERKEFIKRVEILAPLGRCRICSMIVALSAEHDFLSFRYRREPLLQGELYRHLNKGPISTPGCASATLLILSGLPDIVKTPKMLDFRMDVWADEGSVAASTGVISSLPHIQGADPREFYTLINHWMLNCMSHHDLCTKIISGESLDDLRGTELPTRVLDVRSGSDQDLIYLKEPRNQVGHYCALSYCWGELRRHPPKTTRQNLDKHLAGISISSLPRTFQDAIALTQSIGVNYLWIDSLCIVQNDEDNQDWRQESGKMGKFYEKAYLIIAAAGAKDSTEGLFATPRDLSASVEVPFYHAGAEIKGTFRITLPSQLQAKPSFGPLRSRAWAYQEWHLARRIVFFMPGGMTWMCKTEEYDERGHSLEIRGDVDLIHSGDTFSWLSLLSNYSRSQLSVFTDRLPAIQGIANELQEARDDTYGLGVFTSDLEKQLVWMCCRNSRHHDDQPNLPSWCWASLGGPKGFLADLLPSVNDFKASDIITRVSLGSNGDTIVVNGALKYAWVGEQPFKKTCLLHFQVGTDEFCTFPEKMLLEDCPEAFPLWADQQKSAIFGIARFDRSQAREVFILPLISTVRDFTDPL